MPAAAELLKGRVSMRGGRPRFCSLEDWLCTFPAFIIAYDRPLAPPSLAQVQLAHRGELVLVQNFLRLVV